MKYVPFFLVLCAVLTLQAQEKKLAPTGMQMENIDYPFAVQTLDLTVQGQQLQMAYMHLKPNKPNGKNIVLLHGKNFSGKYWERTARDLAAAGFHVIIPDQIGFGKSSKPGNIQFSFQLLAQNTKAVLDALGVKKTAVLGHSMGGMLATRFALMYPEVTEKLILENPIGLEDWKTVVPYQSVDVWYQIELGQTYQKMKAYQRESYYDGQWRPEYEELLLPFAGWTVNRDYNQIAKTSALTYDMIFTQPVLYEFDQLQMPTLLIIGQRDRTALGKAQVSEQVRNTLGNYPALGKLTAQKIVHSTLVAIDDVGHLPHIEAYDQFIEPLLLFLNR